MKYYEIEMLYQENISSDELLDIIHSCTDVKEYFIILHDKDTWSDDVFNDDGTLKYSKGELKKAHYHCYIGYTDFGRNTFSKFKEYFQPHFPFLKPIKNIDSALKYGIHFGYPNKYQYDKKMYLTNNDERLDKVLSTCQCDIECILFDLHNSIIDLKIFSVESMVDFFKEKKQLSYLLSHYTYLCKFLVDTLHSIVDFGCVDKRIRYIKERSEQ